MGLIDTSYGESLRKCVAQSLTINSTNDNNFYERQVVKVTVFPNRQQAFFGAISRARVVVGLTCECSEPARIRETVVCRR